MMAVTVEPRNGRLARQHLEQHAAQAVDVAPPVEVLASVDLLRAHVGRSADHVPGGGLRAADGPGDAEVRHQRVPRIQQDVGRLDVAVDHVAAVRVAQRVRHLASDLERLGHRELTFPERDAARSVSPSM